jgi:NurA domain
MLVKGRVRGALEAKLESFRQAAEESDRLLDLYRAALKRATSADLASEAEWPGARPTEELAKRGLLVQFPERWDSAQEARRWALERLSGIPTVAVDGSQIAASKEFGVPLSLVQVAWFENYHDPERRYIKDLRNDVMSMEDFGSEVDDYAFGESRLNQRRFSMEMEVAVDRIANLPADPAPVVFLDGSLVLSFISRFWPASRAPYLHGVFAVLEASERHRIPVVGYTDLSFASDLVTMLRGAFDLPSGNLFDAQVLDPMMSWFDRTAAFQCARQDVLPLYRTEDRDYAQDLCFVYLKTGRDGPPARIDFPRWVLDAELLDHALDVIRAEIVVGTGYPYTLETADAAAVLTIEDRLAFYRMFRELAEASQLTVSVPGKSISKAHRR